MSTEFGKKRDNSTAIEVSICVPFQRASQTLMEFEHFFIEWGTETFRAEELDFLRNEAKDWRVESLDWRVCAA